MLVRGGEEQSLSVTIGASEGCSRVCNDLHPQDIIELTESLMGLSSSKPKYEEEAEEETRPVEEVNRVLLFKQVY